MPSQPDPRISPIIRKTFLFTAGLYCVLLAGCGGGGSGGRATAAPAPAAPVAADCGIDAQKAFVQAVSEDWYLWYDEMAAVDPADFDSAAAYLSALTAPLAEDFRDPGFSYLTTRAEDEANFTSRAFVGFGFRLAVDDGGRYLVSDVFEGTPAEAAGLRRGAEILAVDDGSGFVTMRDYEDRGANLDEIFGEPVTGLGRVLRLRIDGDVIEAAISKREIEIPPVAAAPRTLERPGLSPAGYVHLRNFTRSARPELDRVFAELSGGDITDFVIDLRYNGGGLLDVADYFADLLGGAVADGAVSYRLSHNDKRRAEDTDYFFDQRADSVSPIRIAFITGEATASASEALINSLAGVVEVVLIGSDTAGKAVGQYGFDQSGCDTRLRLVAFETLNGAGLGGYYTGLLDTGRFTLCAVEDGFTGAFGSGNDALTAGALAWLTAGACPVGALARTDATGLRRGPSPITAANPPDRLSGWVQ